MEVSPDNHLVMSLRHGLLAKLRLTDGSIVYRHKLHEVPNPRGIACHRQDGSYIVADRESRTLHLVSPIGYWVKELWAHPAGSGGEDPLSAVSIMGDLCVCCSYNGSVFVLDVL
ncbi:hypothetical protein ElyMa_000830200 [Elysia marginata]|uniref:Uncharacterized protein n=1 Tax=Elysia marginata TaxID=1093978 RepID=A0AAV4H034_9GAST|nr:hypothetical protein ElyMa_000830200 [Elysia marginata]